MGWDRIPGVPQLLSQTLVSSLVHFSPLSLFHHNSHKLFTTLTQHWASKGSTCWLARSCDWCMCICCCLMMELLQRLRRRSRVLSLAVDTATTPNLPSFNASYRTNVFRPCLGWVSHATVYVRPLCVGGIEFWSESDGAYGLNLNLILDRIICTVLHSWYVFVLHSLC